MNAPVELLFFPRGRDEASILWGPRFTKVTRSATNASISAGGKAGTSADWPAVGPEFIEWITNVRARVTPGAGQNYTKIDIGITDGEGNTLIGLKSLEVDGGANEPGSLDLQVQLPLIGNRYLIRASGTFNSGVAANTLDLEVASIVTIRGNAAMF